MDEIVGAPAQGMTEDISNIDVDGLLGQSDQFERPMDDAPAPAQQAQPAQPQAPAQQPTPQEVMETLTVNGKQVQATKEQLRQWASQGYNYSQQMQALKQQQQQLEAYKPYETVDQYAKQNPEWWQHVLKSYEQRAIEAQKLDPSNPLAQEISQLKSQLNEIGQFKNQILEERTRQQQTQEDQALDTEIKSIREKYSNLDWKTVDENGHDLERQVLAYATKRNIGTFEDAFKSYYHDKLVALEAERAKEALGKDIQKKTKLGLLGKTPTPTQSFQPQNLKSQSYERILDDTLNELGLR